MSALKELQIIKAFSAVTLPENTLNERQIKELVSTMIQEQDSVRSDAERLDKLRQEQKDGSTYNNWKENRSEKIQEAQIDLNKSIGRLTRQTSQLLLVNTAISKVLSDQQAILLSQQDILSLQANQLRQHDEKFAHQQILFSEDQKTITEANENLLLAAGKSQEQATALMRCMARVMESEKKIAAANSELLASLEQRFRQSVEDCLTRMDKGLAEHAEQRVADENRLQDSMRVQSGNLRAELETSNKKLHQEILTQIETMHGEFHATLTTQGQTFEAQFEKSALTLSSKVDELSSTVSRLTSLQEQQQHNVSTNRKALTAIGVVALLSSGWQIVQHFYR
ncbi:hypothetical protein [Janthinobacterium sp. LM6]|uniref:hypothetical protein n=1 Tax=Janthinobacterium sp. LM6 TaxID=1938606 RepID=UPI0012371749|nr:hypothetical protein [Janthinobacterium sp. LM6]